MVAGGGGGGGGGTSVTKGLRNPYKVTSIFYFVDKSREITNSIFMVVSLVVVGW